MKIYKRSRLCMMMACFVWSWSFLMASATWWLLDVPAPNPSQQTRNTKGAKSYCGNFRHLTEKQRALCIHHPTILSKISDGVKIGIRECGYQFRNRRWNCTMYPGNAKDHAFEPVLKNKGPERAYIRAILSASVSYTITRACSGAKLPEECMCAIMSGRALNLNESEHPKVKFEWGGCSDDVGFGDQFAREFFEDESLPLSQGEVLDFHNNGAGRKVVILNNKTTCKCHGLSGTCAQNICWRSLPPLRKISRELLERYDAAVRVKVRNSRVQVSRSARKKLSTTDLIYLKKSPKSFCKPNKKKGSYGTFGRWCNATSSGTEGCENMCCKRGYTTEPHMKSTKCNCKFQWCCHLTCDTCHEMVEESFCK